MPRTPDTLSPPTQPMASLPPDGSEFWRLSAERQAIYLRAHDKGREHAELWLVDAPRSAWEPMATIVGSGSGALLGRRGWMIAMVLLTVYQPLDGTAPSQNAIDALGWYDRAFRGRIDEALDDTEVTR